MTGETLPSRRERKKAATRATILDAALTLFFERGFTAVTVREIAEKADVTPKTVFAHFPHKEALVFSDEEERHERLASAVRDRAPATSISDALKAHYLAEIDALASEPQRKVLALMEDTPSLVDYAEKMWLRHEDSLLDVITAEFGLTEPTDAIRFYVRFALQIQLIATHSTDPPTTIDNGFRLLNEGWAHHTPPTP
jgi:AcrR family transcriptional regulator